MPPFKIVVTLLVLIGFGIVVGSNLSVMMPVVVLNQGTKALPIGVWLIMAIASGILSSSVIQLLLFLQQNSATKKIRQLQTRLQQQDEDIFTYTSTPEPEPEVQPQESRSPFKQAWRNSTATQSDSQPESQPEPEQIETDNRDDWDEQPSRSKLDWDDITPSRSNQESVSSNSSSSQDKRDGSNTKPSRKQQSEPVRIDEVYDADFRLIQPPYKQPPAKFKYIEEEDDEDDDEELQDQRPIRQDGVDNEDWGFDFDDEVAEIESKKSKSRRI